MFFYTILILSFVTGYKIIPRFIRNKCIKCSSDEYLDNFFDEYDMNKIIPYENITFNDEISIKTVHFDTNNTKEEEKSIYTHDTYIQDIKKLRENYGAFKNGTNEVKPKKKSKKKAEENAKKYIADMFRKQLQKKMQEKKSNQVNEVYGTGKMIKHNENNQTSNNLVFFVTPTQLNHLKAYNKTMHRERERRLNMTRHRDDENKNRTLPDNSFDDDHYLWF